MIGQFSSIGSLGPASSNWLTSEWLTSLSTCQRKKTLLSTSGSTPDLQLVSKTVTVERERGGEREREREREREKEREREREREMSHLFVRYFLQLKILEIVWKVTWVSHYTTVPLIYIVAGGSVPYSNQTAIKQPYLTSFMW